MSYIGDHFAGSDSHPDVDRLLRHLFDPENQPHNLMTIPTGNDIETVNILVRVNILKFVGLVS